MKERQPDSKKGKAKAAAKKKYGESELLVLGVYMYDFYVFWSKFELF